MSDPKDWTRRQWMEWIWESGKETHGFAALRLMHVAVERDGDIPEAAKRWIRDSIIQYELGEYKTLDEAFEIITLMQTKKIGAFPIVGMGGEFWNKLREFTHDTMIAEGTISPSDIDLIQRADTVDEAISFIRG